MDIAKVLTHTLVGAPRDAAADIAIHFHPSYQQTSNGLVRGYDEFVKHIAHVREVSADAEVLVHEYVSDGRGFAEHHTTNITRHDGSSASLDVVLIGSLAEDGRLLRITESSRRLSDDAAGPSTAAG